MIPKITKNQIKIGNLGTFNLKIPYLTLGRKDKPKITIVANLHGCEITPLFVLQKLVNLLIKREINGRITIFPAANPLGLLFKTREEPIDNADLNRIAPGNPSKDFSQRIISGIFKICQDSNLVIDLHNFSSRQSPIVGILIAPANKKTIRIFRSFGPDVIWQINLQKKEDQRFRGALDIELSKKGITTLAVEMPPLSLTSKKDINRITKGLLRAIEETGVILKEKKDSPKKKNEITLKKIPIFSIKYVYSDTSGLFFSTAKLRQKIKKGGVLGYVIELNDFQTKKILKSPLSGEVITIIDKGFVRTGTKIASIGQKIKDL